MIKLRDSWVFGYVTGDNNFIAPVVINENAFPIGFPLYSSVDSVRRQVEREQIIHSKIPLPDEQRVECFRIGEGIDPDVYLFAVMHMYREAIRATPLAKIQDVAEGEFRQAKVFVDPPLMKVTADMVDELFQEDRVFPVSLVPDIDVGKVTSWRP